MTRLNLNKINLRMFNKHKKFNNLNKMIKSKMHKVIKLNLNQVIHKLQIQQIQKNFDLINL